MDEIKPLCLHANIPMTPEQSQKLIVTERDIKTAKEDHVIQLKVLEKL